MKMEAARTGVVAVQSSWDETTRVVHGHRFHPLERMIEAELDSAVSKSQSSAVS